MLGGGLHDSDAVTIATILGPEELREPTDVALRLDAPTPELWITNRAASSVTVVRAPGTAEQMATQHAALGNTHFLPKPAALAFGAPGFMATIHETDEITQFNTPADFMGPTLWSSDPALFDGGQPSHLDMLHNSPNGVGIAWERDNVYWIVDGYHRSLTRYDFALDHGPGQHDHSDGVISRCVEGMISYLPGVSAHAEMDHETSLLYVADPGSSRVLALDITSGTRGATLFPNYDGAEMYSVDNATLMTVIEGSEVGLVQPSGLAIHDDMIFVSDAATSVIAAFDLESYELVDWISIADVAPPGSLRGIDFDSEGRLYVADVSGSRVLRIASKTH